MSYRDNFVCGEDNFFLVFIGAFLGANTLFSIDMPILAKTIVMLMIILSLGSLCLFLGDVRIYMMNHDLKFIKILLGVLKSIDIIFKFITSFIMLLMVFLCIYIFNSECLIENLFILSSLYFLWLLCALSLYKYISINSVKTGG